MKPATPKSNIAKHVAKETLPGIFGGGTSTPTKKPKPIVSKKPKSWTPKFESLQAATTEAFAPPSPKQLKKIRAHVACALEKRADQMHDKAWPSKAPDGCVAIDADGQFTPEEWVKLNTEPSRNS